MEEKLTSLPEFPELTFDDEKHEYRVTDIIIPSVSSIMQPLSDAKYRRVDSKTLDKAADKGTSVHNAIENWILYGIDDIPAEHEAYFKAFLDWWNEYQPEVVATETKMYHTVMLYGGTADLVAYIEGELALIDFKTTYTLYDMTCGVQLEAYKQALLSHGVPIKRKYILHLKKNAKYEFRRYDDNDSRRWRVFGALKTIYDYIQSK